MQERGSSWTQVQSDVRFGSKADMCGAERHVRFTPESGHAAIHSINSSARPASVFGTVTPSALADLRLMNSSTFVAC